MKIFSPPVKSTVSALILSGIHVWPEFIQAGYPRFRFFSKTSMFLVFCPLCQWALLNATSLFYLGSEATGVSRKTTSDTFKKYIFIAIEKLSESWRGLSYVHVIQMFHFQITSYRGNCGSSFIILGFVIRLSVRCVKSAVTHLWGCEVVRTRGTKLFNCFLAFSSFGGSSSY